MLAARGGSCQLRMNSMTKVPVQPYWGRLGLFRFWSRNTPRVVLILAAPVDDGLTASVGDAVVAVVLQAFSGRSRLR